MIFFQKTKIGLVLLAALWGVMPAYAGEVVGRGDFTFYLDTAAFRAPQGRVLEEIYVRIPNNEVTLRESKEGFAGKLKVSVIIADLEGNRVVQDAEEIRINEDDETRVGNSLYFQTVIKRYLLDPGVYLLSYAVEDLEAPKKTVFGMVRGKFKTSAVRKIRIHAPEMPDDVPSFSLPMFVWDIEDVEGKPLYHPNPTRMYGLYKDTLAVYVELYLPDTIAETPTFEFKSYILDVDGNTLAERTVSLPNPNPSGRGGGMQAYPIIVREDLATFPAGAYFLNFAFGVDNRTLSRVRAGKFSVAWDIRTWEVTWRSYMAEAKFLLGDKEFKGFQQLSAGEQEKKLDELWKAEDPAPETGVNEAYEKFLDRLAYVNQSFTETVREPIFTDRGQIYMKWGPPDEFIEDVIPVNRETISEAFAKVENKYHSVNYSTHGVKPYLTPVLPTINDPRRMSQVGEGGNTAFPFELWIYSNAGDPILEGRRVFGPDIGMRYLFVDREGFGVYKLETSTKISDK